MDGMTKNVSTMTSIGQSTAEAVRANVEAFMESGRIWAAGCQLIGREMATAARAHVEQVKSTCNTMGSMRSPTAVLELRITLARVALEAAVAEATRLSGASTRLVEQTMAPITARMTQSVEKLAPPAA